jgi:hypothetical protein
MAGTCPAVVSEEAMHVIGVTGGLLGHKENNVEARRYQALSPFTPRRSNPISTVLDSCFLTII